MNLSRTTKLALLVAGLASAHAAHATMYCISTVSGLNASMSAANTANEGTQHELRLRPGTYNVPAGLEFDPAGDKDSKNFSLTGGWNSGCSARTINASTTVLNAENGATDGDFRFFGNNTHYVIEGIRFSNFRDFVVDDANCNLDCPDTQLIRIRYNELRNGTDVTIRGKDAATLTVSNNLFAGLNPGSGTAVGISYVNNESAPTIAFNTVANVFCSSGAGEALYVYTQRSGVTLHHNIVQSVGCGGDITVPTGSGSQSVALRHNLYNTLSGLAPSLLSGNVITPSPGFIDSAGGNFRLKESAPMSAAINAGMTPTQAQTLGLNASIPSQDLDGPAGARLVGNQYDMGAYESSINNASVLTVTNTNDSGAGSLRAQIAAANASPGLQKIEFNIPGSCTSTPHLILLQSVLPDITDSLEIDGYSEPETAANTLDTGSDAVLCIVIASQSAVLPQALQVPQGAPAATSLTVKGIAFVGGTGLNGNFSVAIRLRGGSDHVIQGNAFAGTGPGEIGPLGTLFFGLQIRNEAQNVLVGGADPEHRNSFGAMDSSAIVLNDATSGGHRIQNNYIGLTASGTTSSPIGLNGIFASNSPNIEILDNVIASVSNNAAIAIQGATATGYRIAGNRIGTSAFGVPNAALRNQVGIQFADGTGNHVVGSLLGLTASNIISNSDDAGVWITATAGNGITVRPNQIFGNGVSGLGLGVDIGPLGQSTNDTNDPDGGANRGQNHPSITASLPNADGSRQVGYALDSTPNTTFRIDIYRAPSCPGGNRGGDMFNRVGSITGSSNAQGDVVGNFAVSGAGAPAILVAQATNLATGDSSEPGLCFIEPIATTTIITNDTPDPSAFGQPYTVSVLVSGVSGSPTGSVTVDDGQGSQCSDSTIVGGIASCQMLSTSLGNKTLTANYSGSVTHAPSSDTESHSVVQASTVTTIVGDTPDPSQVGQPYTVSVQVRTPAGNLAIPGGQVSVSDGTGQTCQIAALVNGDGSCQLTSVSVGNKTLSASYAGAVNFAASSDTEAHTVTAAATTTTITSDAPDPSLPGQAYTVNVSVSTIPGAGTPSGAVAVNDGAGASCNITLAAGSGSCQLASAALGNKTLTANYTPASQAFAASSDTESHTVALGATTTTITSDTPDPSSVGEPYLVQVSVASAAGSPTGAVTIGDGSGASCNANLSNGVALCQLVSTTGGAKTLSANYAGDANFAPSSDTETHQVAPINTVTTITSDQPDPSPAGSAYTVAVTVTATSGTVGGSVTVTDGTGGACQITLSQGGGSCQLTSASVGQKTLVANYGGNASYNPSSDTEAHTVNPIQAAATVTTITADTPEPTVPGQPYTVSVSVTSQGGTPAGTVNVNDGAGAGAGNCQISLENGSGSCQLISNFAGDRLLTACFVATPAFSGSCDNEVHQTIKADTDLSFNGFAPNPPVEDAPTQVSIALAVAAPGSGTPTGTVTVSASASESCVINLPATSCPLTMTTAGMRTITLSYSGDANFNPSSRQTQQNVLVDSLLANGFE